nr:hypothetical protein [Tanacetum cinerariifolium]
MIQKRLDDKKSQIQECKVQEVQSSVTSSGDESSRSRNECNDKSFSGDDTDIKPSYETEPMVEVPYTAEHNVFVVDTQHSEQPECINKTCIMETGDSNVIPDSSNMCNNDNQVDQNAAGCTDEQCSSCGALYTTDNCCFEGSLGDRIICDLNKAPDLSQRSLQNCPKSRNPVDGHYCQGCALLRNKFKEDLFTYCIENGILQDSFKPSNDNTNVVNALQEPFVVNQDPNKNSSQSPPQINHHCCYGCGESLEDIFCHQCTYELYGKEISLEFLQEKRNQIDSVKTFMRKFNRISFYEMPKVLSLAWETILKIKLAFNDKHYQPEDILELFRRLHNDVQNIHEELAVYIITPN